VRRFLTATLHAEGFFDRCAASFSLLHGLFSSIIAKPPFRLPSNNMQRRNQMDVSAETTATAAAAADVG